MTDQERDDQRDAVTRHTTPKTPAERAREYRKRKRDGVVEAIVTPSTVTPHTPEVTIQPVTPTVGMTKSERDDLIKITRERGRVAKAQVDAVTAELAADVEKKLSEEFKMRDSMWKEAVEVAEKAVADANAHIARVLDDRGVPKEFRSEVMIGWASRGRMPIPPGEPSFGSSRPPGSTRSASRRSSPPRHKWPTAWPTCSPVG